MATLDFTRAPASPDENTRVIRLLDGSFVVGPVYGYTEVLRFDSIGRFLDAHGRYGHGPGEYVNIQNIDLVDDSLWVFDPFQQRCSVVAITVVRVVRAFRCRGQFDEIAVIGRNIVAVGGLHRASQRGESHRARVIRENGSALPLAAESVQSSGGHGTTTLALAASNDPNIVWIADVFTYVLEKRRIDNDSLLVSFRRSPAWFEMVQEDREHRSPAIADLRSDMSGERLWVAIAVERLRSDKGIPRRSEGASGGTVIEVINQVDGSLVTATYLQNVHNARFTTDGHLYASIGAAVAASGAEHIWVWELSLSRTDAPHWRISPR